MLRSLFSAAAIFFLLFSTFFVPSHVSARSRCPVKMPETLLSLYQNSDAIYIAAFDKKVDGEIVEDTADYSSVNIKKHFSISSALKGESRKFVVLDDTEYRYKNAAEAPDETAEEEESEDPEASVELKPGDTLLLFLKKGEEGEGPTLTDYRDGTKKLSMEHIGVYEARIKELASIFSEKKVSDAKIVEWLVRCAEDPVTRWEGTFELLQSVQNLEWQERSAEERKARIARGEPVEEEAVPESEEAEEEEEGEVEIYPKNVDTSTFAKLVDANQKQTLANILLNQAAPAREEDEKKQAEIRGDEELVELVKRWGDPRLVGFLLDQLRANTSEPYIASRTMATIAEILSNKEVEKIAEKYAEIAYEDDDSETTAEPDESAVGGDKDQETAEPETGPIAEPESTEASRVVNVEAAAANEDEGKEDKPKKITYKQLRDEAVQKFIRLCDAVLAEDENSDLIAETEAT